ncbi:glycolate oxidase subunit GlcE [Leeia aquatica]|uniref:Glycolate oxidase subunit GlcE n=1 Tax=Leeia aquatica TaxID=2725557 RepID=A0A847SAX6_9NEIS|nr:glycolate oxidase subunit GlcE [Leeia aquatica]NLR76067.1 glycolate oxidase subunit GlcE [Leeia aquatica]
MLDALQAQIRQACHAGQPLAIRGGGSHAGQLPAPGPGHTLQVSDYQGIVQHDPAELVITVRAGTPIAVVNAHLAQHQQMLAHEPPEHDGQATVGGMVATASAGPRRVYRGPVRDQLLGAQLIDGRGELLRFGGRVMKNVAGFDISRMLAGSRGSLGVLTELTFRVWPLPEEERTLVFAAHEQEAITWLNQWAGQPLPLSGSAWQDGQLWIRLSGHSASVTAAHRLLGGGLDEAPPWSALREQHFARQTLSTGEALWRLSVPPTAPPLALPGLTLLEWGGGLRWLKAPLSAEAIIRQRVQALGGHCQCWRAEGAPQQVFDPLPAPLLALQQRIKARFDPAGVFNPGLFYPTL